MQTTTISITGMTCGHCVASVRAALSAVPGVHVQEVRVGSATVEPATPAALDAAVSAIQDAGYDAAVAEEVGEAATSPAGGIHRLTRAPSST
jgi:copper chaperone CopZ